MIGSVMQRVGERLPQVELRWLGGLKTIAGRLTFYRGFLSFLMLIPAAYNLSPVIQSVFPTVWLFSLFLFGVLGVAAVFEYSIVYPSQLRFDKAQASKNGRDPIYRQTESIQEEIAALHERLDDLEERDQP